MAKGKSNNQSTQNVSTPLPDPYEWGKCYINVGIKIFPDDGNESGPLVCIGARTHQDSPILKFVRLSDIEPLPAALQAVLDQLKEELPEREQRSKELKATVETSTPAAPTTASSVGEKPSPAVQSSTPDQLDLFNTLGS